MAKISCHFFPYGIGGDVPVLQAPDVNSPVLRTITMGEKYLVIDRAGEWRTEKDRNAHSHRASDHSTKNARNVGSAHSVY
jgi:hypothetical protein